MNVQGVFGPSAQHPGRFGNSLAAHIAAAIDSRLGGKSAASALDLYDTITHDDEGPFERNASFWGADLAAKFSCASPSNSTGNHLRAVTAITPRHCIACKHGGAASYPADGASIRFVAADNTVVVRTQSQHLELAGADFALILLSSDLPATITPCKVLPDDVASYLRTFANIPFIVLDQQEKGLVHESDAQGAAFWTAKGTAPGNAARAEFYELMVAGDSGNPWLVPINGELVLVGVTTSDTQASSPSGLNSLLNSGIASVDALGSVSTGYTVSNPDLSGFTEIN